MQAKITAARREAESLKDRIKRKKDDLADTSRECEKLFSLAEQLSYNDEMADFGGRSATSGTSQY